MAAPQHIVVVGGGITGLAAAHAVVQANRRLRLGVECTLVEGSERFGGKIQSEHAGGFLVEQGPDSMLARKVEGRAFCEEIGLSGDLVGSNHDFGSTYVVQGGRLEPLPEGTIFVAPTRLRPWMQTRLFSPAGKLRAALDLVLPARRDDVDESLEAFVRRRFGEQVADRLAVPLLASVYGGGSGDLSVRASFPELASLERKHRSVLLGLRDTGRRRSAAGRSSIFLTLRHGMHSMVSATVDRLEGARLISGTPATQLSVRSRQNGRWRYALTLANGAEVEADGVILATPAFATQRLLEGLAPDAAAELAQIDYQATSVVVVAYPKARIANPMMGTGFLVPQSAHRRIIACTWVSRKWPHVSDANDMLMRCYVGGSAAAPLMALPDEDLVKVVCEELRDLLGTQGEPSFSRVYRWHQGIPRYAVGHLERVARIEASLHELPGLVVAGAAYRGIGVPDCIRQGRAAAEALLGPDAVGALGVARPETPAAAPAAT